MLTSAPASWTVRGATFALWAAVGLTAVFWGLRLAGGASQRDLPAPAPRTVAAADPAAIARLLGGGAPAAAGAAAPVATLASRFQLVGVVAGERSGRGAAVIAVDGKPARPFAVGTVIDEGVVLQSVQGRSAILADQAGGTPLLTLELPPLKK